MSTHQAAQAFAATVDRTNGELDAAVLAHRDDPTPHTLARVLAAQRAHTDDFHAELAGEYVHRTTTAPVQAAPTGTRFYCAASVSDDRRRAAHDSGDGRPLRKRCRYCKGELRTERGSYGVFSWRGDGRYRLADAHETFARETTADRYATRDTTYVVRWLVDIG